MKLYQQEQTMKGKTYNVGDLVEKSKEYTPELIDLRLVHKNYALGLDNGNTDLFDIVKEFKRVDAADLKYPIILCDNGFVLDGKHRVTKAIYLNKKKIKAVIIPEDDLPPATRIE